MYMKQLLSPGCNLFLFQAQPLASLSPSFPLAASPPSPASLGWVSPNAHDLSMRVTHRHYYLLYLLHTVYNLFASAIRSLGYALKYWLDVIPPTHCTYRSCSAMKLLVQFPLREFETLELLGQNSVGAPALCSFTCSAASWLSCCSS